MKKILYLLLMIVLVSLLFACSSTNDKGTVDKDNEASSLELSREIDGNKSKEAFEEITFIGTIDELNGDQALVSIEEGEILRSGSKVDVNLSVASETSFKIGDKVKVGFDGDIRETFPLGINTTFVELVK
ncbi:hypothetical protein [Amphibacillus indicireducens]|uniref:DUF3221 domain-containing protein n=1 Tax=Amphibacillus indicireducens TaxID=1076330 RepID=A0ABP7VCD7_9BACI